MREVQVESKQGIPPWDAMKQGTPYEQVVFWRHQRNIAVWLLAESQYLRDLEFAKHQNQWREHRRYKNQLVYAQKWLLAEARWYAKVADEIAGTILGPRTNPLPWEGQHGDQRR